MTIDDDGFLVDALAFIGEFDLATGGGGIVATRYTESLVALP